jgi:hypothetical protein
MTQVTSDGSSRRKNDNANNLVGNLTLPEFLAYKYSNNKKCTLHESIILGGVPAFIKYEDGEVKVVQEIKEACRIIRPPKMQDYPYLPYEFANLNEVQDCVNRSKSENIDSLYYRGKPIVEKYVDQPEIIIIGIASDIIWSYHQDLFATTHYVNVTGDNETGKSTIGHIFQCTGYRPVRGTSISAANYYRMLGTIEPGQATFIEDEADYIEDDKEKLKILKEGYGYDSRIPKINMRSADQKQDWFYDTAIG